MKVFYLLSLLGLISCSTYMPKVEDIWYNYEYQLSKIYSGAYNDYSFRLPVIPGDKMDVEIKIPKGNKSNFYLYFKGFPNKPSDQELFNYAGKSISNSGLIHYDQGDYSVYPVTLLVPEGCNYLGIHVTYPIYFPYSDIILKVNVAKYGYSAVHDLSSIKSLTVDKSIFENRIIPVNYKIYIKSSVNPYEKIAIQLNTKYEYNKDLAFQVNVYEFSSEPTDAQIYYTYGAKRTLLYLQNYSNDPLSYLYYFTADKDIKYFAVKITVNEECKGLAFLNVSIGPAEQK